MIDWHTHVLPNIDDGSKSVEESLSLLQMLKNQGIQTVVATPHFLPQRHSVNEFLEKREQAYALLQPHLSKELPIIKLGAEVAYYEGISRLEGLNFLRIQGSKILLLEMPYKDWTEYAVNEVLSLAHFGNVIPMIAHVERSLTKRNVLAVKRLALEGVLFQTNASYVLQNKTKAVRLFKNKMVHIIGSDCHNLIYRAPNIGEAYAWLEKKLGLSFCRSLHNVGRSLLSE